MQVVTAAEMRDMDRQAVERYAIPEIVLMEHAGKALADRAWQLVNGSSRRRVVIFVGKGNNGGDGCVAARHLHNRGATVRLVPIDEPNKFTGECASQLDMAAHVGVEIIPLSKRTERKIQFHAAAADLIIDAVLGTGSRARPGGGPHAIELINGAGESVGRGFAQRCRRRHGGGGRRSGAGRRNGDVCAAENRSSLRARARVGRHVDGSGHRYAEAAATGGAPCRHGRSRA